MIRFDKTIIGSYIYKPTEKSFKVEIRSGNCDSVHVWRHKKEDGWYIDLFTFVANATHLQIMEKDGYDIFKDCTNIRLNVYFEQNVRLMKYATKFGHKVTCYYKKL